MKRLLAGGLLSALMLLRSAHRHGERCGLNAGEGALDRGFQQGYSQGFDRGMLTATSDFFEMTHRGSRDRRGSE